MAQAMNLCVNQVTDKRRRPRPCQACGLHGHTRTNAKKCVANVKFKLEPKAAVEGQLILQTSQPILAEFLGVQMLGRMSSLGKLYRIEGHVFATVARKRLEAVRQDVVDAMVAAESFQRCLKRVYELRDLNDYYFLPGMNPHVRKLLVKKYVLGLVYFGPGLVRD